MKVAIIGAGVCGLTAAYHLTESGHQVTIFEKEKKPGGLVSSFKKETWQWFLEYYPHHLFTSDHDACRLINRLGLGHKLFFKRPKTSIFLKGKIFQFDSPASILKAPFFSWPQKMRIALVTLYLKTTRNWPQLEPQTAISWLNRFYGPKASRLLWEPLLRGKFGRTADQVAMSWLWARIKKRSASLGYLQGGFQVLIDKLIQVIQSGRGKIVSQTEIRTFEKIRKEFEKVIVTTPTATFLKMTLKLPSNYQKNLGELQMIGALSLVLRLKRRFLKEGTYWLNINEGGWPFVFVDEHTNFIDPAFYGHEHLVYVGGYYPQEHRYFKIDKEKIFIEFLPYLRKINPEFDFSLFTIHYSLFTNLYAQPVVPVNYSSMIPPHQTPLEDVYLANMEQIYPWDRGINYSIKLGKKIAEMVEVTR